MGILKNLKCWCKQYLKKETASSYLFLFYVISLLMIPKKVYNTLFLIRLFYQNGTEETRENYAGSSQDNTGIAATFSTF